MDLACGIYAITTAVAIQMFERSRYGRTRKKQKFYPRVLVYIFMILPALTINFVETSRIAKDRMQRLKAGGRNRANQSDAYFTDDGFALGCAFILTTLKLGRRFDTLHWFDTLKTKFDTEARSIDATRRGTKKSDKDALTELQLKTQRVAIYQVRDDTVNAQ